MASVDSSRRKVLASGMERGVFRTSLATDLRYWSAETGREQARMRLLGNNFMSLWEYAYKAHPLPTIITDGGAFAF